VPKTKAKIPRFKTYEEEAQWWDAHDVTDIEGLELVGEEILLKPRRQIVSIRLERKLVEILKRLAARQGVGHTTLVRMWVVEKLRELAKQARARGRR
jgi:predicted DNA binding CopG/RHH family protein